jgi:hypothetical protein
VSHLTRERTSAASPLPGSGLLLRHPHAVRTRRRRGGSRAGSHVGRHRRSSRTSTAVSASAVRRRRGQRRERPDEGGLIPPRGGSTPFDHRLSRTGAIRDSPARARDRMLLKLCGRSFSSRRRFSPRSGHEVRARPPEPTKTS